METELTYAITAKTAAHAEMTAARIALKDAKRGYHIASTRLRHDRGDDSDWTAHLKAQLAEAGAELAEATRRLADAGTLMQRASALAERFLEGSAE